MSSHNDLIRGIRLKIGGVLALRNCLRYSTLWAFLLGAIVLVVRVIFVLPASVFSWTLLSGIPFVLFGLAVAVRQIPSRKVLKVLYDERNHCGGLLMAADEVDLGKWDQKIGKVSSPSVKWRAKRTFGLFAAAMTFVAISFLMPQRYVSRASAQGLDISDDVEVLQEQIETLEEEDVISQETADEFEKKLAQVWDEATGDDPVKTWESLDHLEQSLKKAAQEQAASALSQTEGLAKAETLADGLAQDGGGLSSEMLASAMGELAAMMQTMSAENEMLKSSLSSDLLEALKDGGLTAEQLKQLAEALKGCKLNLSECMGAMCAAGLIDAKMLKLCEGMGKCDGKGLMAFLCENGDCMGMGEALTVFCNKPGRGGVTRGRGDAAMTWTDGSSEEGADFKEQVLPAASLAALKESAMVGVSIGAPTIEDSEGGGASGVLKGAKSGSGEAYTHTLLPRHKGTVKRYFERE